MNILCSFSFEQQEFTLAELTRIQNLPKSTTYRLVSTLVDLGFLKYDTISRCYSLGMKIIELGHIAHRSLSLRKVAYPFVDRLQITLRKSVFLGVLWDDELVYIDRKDDPRDTIRFGSERGRRRPPYFGMLGQLLMAFLPPHEVDRLMIKAPLFHHAKRSITDPKEFKAKLEKIAEQGFVHEEGEVFDGISGVAAPIRDSTGKVVAGVGVGFITSAQDEEDVRTIIKEVRTTGKEISEALGYLADSSWTE